MSVLQYGDDICVVTFGEFFENFDLRFDLIDVTLNKYPFSRKGLTLTSTPIVSPSLSMYQTSTVNSVWRRRLPRGLDPIHRTQVFFDAQCPSLHLWSSQIHPIAQLLGPYFRNSLVLGLVLSLNRA
jgi:hypothetical protein